MHQDEGRIIVEVDPASPQAWKKAPFEATLRAWAAAGTEVVVLIADKGLRLGQPDRPVKATRT